MKIQRKGTPETPTPAGGFPTDSVSTKGKEHVATAPALCISLAVHDGTFLSPADHLVCLGQEDFGAFLAVVHMALTANTKTQLPHPEFSDGFLYPSVDSGQRQRRRPRHRSIDQGQR